VWLFVLNVAVVTYMFVLHGGIARAKTPAQWLVALGQLSGLYAAITVLLGLVMISRTPWLERRYGMDRMTHAHRLVGFTAAWLMIVHVVSVMVGIALDQEITLWDQIVDAWFNYSYMPQAIFGFGLLMLVASVSVRAIRRVLSYEQWWLVHVWAYLGVLLGFFHQIGVGADFVLDWWAFLYWTLLHVSVAVLIFGFRLITPWVLTLRHRFRVDAVLPEAADTVTLVVGGRNLDRLAVQPGQFFLIRVLDRRRFWRAHPFSLSAAPDGLALRFTVKALGDDTTHLQTIAPGTRLSLEGPYGGFLAHLPTSRKILFITGGIGITPFRSLIEDWDHAPGTVTLLYRNRTPEDALFHDELEELSRRKGFEVHFSYSRMAGGDPRVFEPERLRAIVPDLTDREVFVIGSPRLLAAAGNGLRVAGVPSRQVHYENFAY
jgi:predicted ferric reductase